MVLWLQFLSMKLSAASAYYDLNSLDIEPTDTFQVIITNNYRNIVSYISVSKKKVSCIYINSNCCNREGICIVLKRWKRS